MIGDDSAPTYFSVGKNGEVKLKSGVNLKSDTETTYIVSMSIYVYCREYIRRSLAKRVVPILCVLR